MVPDVILTDFSKNSLKFGCILADGADALGHGFIEIRSCLTSLALEQRALNVVRNCSKSGSGVREP